MSATGPIIVGIDFTPSCLAALAEALRRGKASGAPVKPVHVIDRLVVTDLTEVLPPGPAPLESDLVEDAHRAWAEFAAATDGVPAPALTVLVAHRVHGLVRAVRDENASMLVVGSHGERARDAGVGSVAAACVRRSPADVMLVRDGHRGAFRRVVACVDFSEHSLCALRRAGELAVADGAELRVLHVFQAPWHRLHYRAPTPEVDPHFQHQYREALERRLRAVTEQEVGAAHAAKAVYAVLDRRADRNGIVEYIDECGADLVVLGSHGRTDLLDFLLGTTAEAVLQDARASVLAVKIERARHAATRAADAVAATQRRPAF